MTVMPVGAIILFGGVVVEPRLWPHHGRMSLGENLDLLGQATTSLWCRSPSWRRCFEDLVVLFLTYCVVTFDRRLQLCSPLVGISVLSAGDTLHSSTVRDEDFKLSLL
jgi:hypothetical protein